MITASNNDKLIDKIANYLSSFGRIDRKFHAGLVNILVIRNKGAKLV